MKVSLQQRRQFEEIYLSNYARLKRFATTYLICEEDAENIVQDVFLDLWEQHFIVTSNKQLFSWLFKTTKNKCIDFLRHKTVARKITTKLEDAYYLELQMKLQSLEEFDDNIFTETDVEQIVQNAIESLPEKCKEIFIMNKLNGKKQKEIAAELNISIHTVESQMAIAHKKLREILKKYIPLLLFCI